MDRKRYRSSLLVLGAVLMAAVNFVTVPLFLYAAFGSDATLDYSGIGWFVNVLLSGWVFFLIPNLPLAGMLVSIWQVNKRQLYFHTGTFLGILVGGLLFFMGEGGLFWIGALIITEACGITSLILLWNQFINKKKNNHLPQRKIR